MKHIFRLTLIAACLLIVNAANKAHANNNIAVLEYYSGLGCKDSVSSDRAFYNVAAARHSNLIAVSCHVESLDKDTPDPYSLEFCDFRLDEYSENVTQDFSSPKMLINGKFEIRGNNEKLLRDALEMGHSLNTIEPIQLEISNNSLNITLPELSLEKPASIWLLGYKKELQSGHESNLENGKASPYINLITTSQKLLEWSGGYRNMSLSTNDFPAEGYAIIAQYSDHTDIIAAGKIEKP